MNYSALIENRKSVREFRSVEVPMELQQQLEAYYVKGCQTLDPTIKTELTFWDTEAREALEGSAGYEKFLVGAPHYLMLLTEKKPHAGENAGYMMEDLVLKLNDLGLDSCWITFTDSDKVKAALGCTSSLEVGAIVAFGYGVRTMKKMRLNIFSMSNVDILAQRSYYSQKKDINEMVFVDRLDNVDGLDERIGFYEDMYWQSFYAASKAPSYLNRQPYAFVMKDQKLILVRLPDPYTDEADYALDLGIVLLHFTAVAQQWAGKLDWDLDAKPDLELPADCSVAAVCQL